MAKKIKMDAKSLKRLALREAFSNEYKELNRLIRANASTFYAMYKYSFYNVKSGEELLQKKNLNGTKLSKYLDYVDESELKYLLRGVTKIKTLCAEPSTDFIGYAKVYNEICKYGLKQRHQYFKTYKVYPEDRPICRVTTRCVKSLAQNQSVHLRGQKSLSTLEKEYEMLRAQRDRLMDSIEAVEAEINDKKASKTRADKDL